MKTVKIYNVTCTTAYQMCETGKRFRLIPWGENTRYYEGYDDGGKDYILPDGYEVAENNCGSLGIYNANGKPCELITMRNTPVILDANGHDVKEIFLNRA